MTPPVIGQLGRVSHSSGTYEEKTVYDALLRPVTQKITIDGQEYKTKTGYDHLSRVATLTYPTGFTIRYHYNSHGYLSAISDDAAQLLFWQAEALNARGQLERQLLGNGAVTQQLYQPTTGRLQGINTEHNGAVIQSLTYTFDTIGNLTQRTDQRQGLSETFSYDDLNRLTTVILNGQAPKTAAYDAGGNIIAPL